MRLDRVLADDEVGGDLGVGDARARSGAAPRSRAAVSSPSAGGGALGARRGELLDQPRVTDGAKSEPPSATTRIAVTQPLLGRVLEQEAAGTRAQRVVDDLVEVEGREHEHARARLADDDPPRRLDPVHHRACARPSARRRARARARARPPRRRRPPGRRPRARASPLRIIRKPARTSSWSSAMRTRIIVARVRERARGRRSRPRLADRRRARRRRSATRSRMPDEAAARAVAVRRCRAPSSTISSSTASAP